MREKDKIGREQGDWDKKWDDVEGGNPQEPLHPKQLQPYRSVLSVEVMAEGRIQSNPVEGIGDRRDFVAWIRYGLIKKR